VVAQDRRATKVLAIDHRSSSSRRGSHARQRMLERGATEAEIIATVEQDERFPAKFGRTGFRRNFIFKGKWRSRFYRAKQVEVIAVPENGWLASPLL